jgi:hypothetical protein
MRGAALFRTGGIVLAIVLAAAAILAALSAATAQVDRAIYRQRATEAIRTGVLAEPALTPLRGDRPNRYGFNESRYHFNDCLIMTMLVLEPKDRGLRKAISPLIPADSVRLRMRNDVPRHAMCDNLVRSLHDPRIERDYYHRYVHGDWIVAALLLYFLPLSHASSALFALILMLPIAMGIVAARRVRDPHNSHRPREAAYFGMSIGFLLFSGVWLFGWSFSFAPSDIVLLGFLMFGYRFPLTTISRPKLIYATAVLGCLTAVFEFLNGATPAALAIILASLAFNSGLRVREALQRGLLGLSSFSLAFATTFLCKAAAVAALWGWPEAADAGTQLGWRLGASPGFVTSEAAQRLVSLGLSPAWFESSRAGGFLFSYMKMVYYSDNLVLGSRFLGFLAIAVGPALLIVTAGVMWARSASRETKARAMLLLGAGLVVFAWYFAFTNHTLGHAHFMMRPLAWLSIFLCGLGAWAWVERLYQAKASASR